MIQTTIRRLLRTLPLLALLAALVAPQPAGAFCFPAYGNWCGEDWPPAGRPAPRPMDAFDAACMRHDLCYARLGDGDRRCDGAFVSDLHRLYWQTGHLPRPLQLAEPYFRARAGGSLSPPLLPMPGDVFGVVRGLLADCE